MIDLGQQRMHEPPYAGRVLNVSVMGGFAYADTPFNGLTVVVTATEAAGGAIAGAARSPRPAGRGASGSAPTLTAWTMPCALPSTATTSAALVFADVADNPGGGGRGNTMWILEAFHGAGVRDALVGVIHDPALAAEAHRLGDGASFRRASTATAATSSPSRSARPAVVRRAARRQPMRGRRGIYANNTLDLGPCRRAAARRHHRRGDLQPRSNAPIRCSSRRSASTSPPPASWW